MDDRLLREISRRNILILLVVLAGSLYWQSLSITLGVLGGGVISVGGYFWLQHSLKELLMHTANRSAAHFKFHYFLRLGSLAALLIVLIVIVRVNPIALSVGLSVVVVNLMWTTFRRISGNNE